MCPLPDASFPPYVAYPANIVGPWTGEDRTTPHGVSARYGAALFPISPSDLVGSAGGAATSAARRRAEDSRERRTEIGSRRAAASAAAFRCCCGGGWYF